MPPPPPEEEELKEEEEAAAEAAEKEEEGEAAAAAKKKHKLEGERKGEQHTSACVSIRQRRWAPRQRGRRKCKRRGCHALVEGGGPRWMRAAAAEEARVVLGERRCRSGLGVWG